MFSLIIPTFNEAENIKALIPIVTDILRPITPFEIIVVDDDSEDGTADVADRLSYDYPEVRCIRRIGFRDLSAAIIAGFQAAKGDKIGVMDADLQHDPTALPQMLEKLDTNDVVIGTRHADGGSVGDWGLKRRFVSWGAAFLAKVLLKTTFTDPMSGYFVLHKKIFTSVAHKLNPQGFKILLEIIFKGKVKRIGEVGYTFQKRKYGESKLTTSVAVQYLLSLYDLVFGQVIPIRFVKFSLVGLSGTIINFIVFTILFYQVGFDEDRSLLGAIYSAMFSNYLLNNYWTFKNNTIQGLVPLLKGFVIFVSICTLGAFINYSSAVTLYEKGGLNIYLANFLGIGVASVWNYLLTRTAMWNRITQLQTA